MLQATDRIVCVLTSYRYNMLRAEEGGLIGSIKADKKKTKKKGKEDWTWREQVSPSLRAPESQFPGLSQPLRAAIKHRCVTGLSVLPPVQLILPSHGSSRRRRPRLPV